MYADDTQIYIIIHPNTQVEALCKLSRCVEDIKQWSCDNYLKLNCVKSEFLYVHSQFRRGGSLTEFSLEDSTIPTSQSVRDLGVIVDKHLNFQQHIKNSCRSAAWGICKIGKIRKLLDQSSTERLIHAFVSSHLDYCNSLLVGLPASSIAPLQRIQNTAARLVTLTKRSDHITPVLQSLHWLPIHQRITFKILLIVYKICNNLAPSYLKDLISFRSSTSTRSLRSSSTLQLSHGPRTCTRYGDRAFSVISPSLWNKLPLHIRNADNVDKFKSSLKTYLFTQL